MVSDRRRRRTGKVIRSSGEIGPGMASDTAVRRSIIVFYVVYRTFTARFYRRGRQVVVTNHQGTGDSSFGRLASRIGRPRGRTGDKLTFRDGNRSLDPCVTTPTVGAPGGTAWEALRPHRAAPPAQRATQSPRILISPLALHPPMF